MSDNDIRQILIERKRKARRKAFTREAAEGLIGWGSLFAMIFMLSICCG